MIFFIHHSKSIFDKLCKNDPRILSWCSVSWLLPEGQGAWADSIAGRPGASSARDHVTDCLLQGSRIDEGATGAASGIRYLREDGPRPCQDVILRVGVKIRPSEDIQVQTKPQVAGNSRSDGYRIRPFWDTTLWIGIASDDGWAGHGCGGSRDPHCCSITDSPRLGWIGVLGYPHSGLWRHS